MAYSDFTLSLVRERLGLTYDEVIGTFDGAELVEPSELLRANIERGLPIALGKGREKARSEALVLPILLEVREVLLRQVSVFSGPEFNIDRKKGLAGYCDFLVGRSSHQTEILAPVIAIVEAKHEDLTSGIPQCLAEMHAARIFNEREGNPIETVYGVTTSGTAWRFLRLTGTHAQADMTEYHIREIEKVLGILVFMAT